MKKIVLLTLLMALAIPAQAVPSSPKETHIPSLARGSQIALITATTKFIGNVNALGESPRTGERLWLAITPSEHVEFLNGKIIRYASVEKCPNDNKAFFTPAIPFVMSAGSEDDYTGVRFFQADGEADALDAATLTIRIDGKECKVVYAAQEKNYSLRCK